MVCSKAGCSGSHLHLSVVTAVFAAMDLLSWCIKMCGLCVLGAPMHRWQYHMGTSDDVTV
jgi:hypothetical protein